MARSRSGRSIGPKRRCPRFRVDDNFASIVEAVKEGRAVFANIRKFLTYILTSNVPELVPYLAFAFARVPLALTVLQILAVDLGTDMLPALGLGAEPPDPRVMERPPRRREERLLTPGVLLRAYLFLGSLEAAAAMSAFFAVLATAGWALDQELSINGTLYREATTACLTAIVFTQAVNVHLCRSSQMSIVSRRFFDNPLITVGVAVEIALILSIAYTAPGHALFGTAPLGPAAWFVILPSAAAMLAAEEARKAFVRRRARVEPPVQSFGVTAE